MSYQTIRRPSLRIEERLAQYTDVHLTADLSSLNDSERAIIPILIEAAQAMDDAFWIQAYGERSPLLAATTDPRIRQYMAINYGPWDRVRDDEPFIAGFTAKPPGTNFYPPDMTAEEFDASIAGQPALANKYTMVRRDASRSLVAIPYHQFFSTEVQFAAGKLREAASLVDQASLKSYLSLRADALLTDDYRASEYGWMDMKDNAVDILIGAMETSADQLYGQKAAFAASVLIKDKDWSQRLARIILLLARFQENLPVPEAYKRDRPGLASDLNVYDVLYCAGYDNASIPIGVSWPDDDEVRLSKGARTLLLKNAMQAKFEKLLAPKADLLIASDQRQYVTPEAYFNFVMFHEIGHGLGIRYTVTGKGPVTEALNDVGHAIEEAKANLLSLLAIDQLNQAGEISDAELCQAYVTELADLLRSCDSRQALLQLNFFKELGAYSRDPITKTYRVHLDRVQAAIKRLAEQLLLIQGDGNYADAKALLDRYARPDDDLKDDLQRFDSLGYPIEIRLI
jgi:hypothetical protein